MCDLKYKYNAMHKEFYGLSPETGATTKLACWMCQPIAEVSSIIALSLWLVNNTYAQLIIKTDGDCDDSQ